MLKAVIMAGGSGTRFGLSLARRCRNNFSHLHGERTLIQQAVDRIVGMVGPEQVLIITNKAHVPRTAEQLPQIPRENIIGEPMGRDTAPCIGLASELAFREDPNARMIVLAADHLIEPTERFHAAVRELIHISTNIRMLSSPLAFRPFMRPRGMAIFAAENRRECLAMSVFSI